MQGGRHRRGKANIVTVIAGESYCRGEAKLIGIAVGIYRRGKAKLAGMAGRVDPAGVIPVLTCHWIPPPSGGKAPAHFWPKP